MGLVGAVIWGVLASTAVLYERSWPRAITICGPCSLFGLCSTIQMGQWPQHVHPTCVIGGWGFPSHLAKLSPLMRYDKIFDDPGVP